MPRKHGPSAAVAFLKEFLPLIGWELCGWLEEEEELACISGWAATKELIFGAIHPM